MSVVPVRFWVPDRELSMLDVAGVGPLDRLLPDGGDWVVEIGFGKGRYLLQQAAERPECRFFGIEIVSRYYRMARDRARRRGLKNLVLARAEGGFLLSGVLPLGFAAEVHVYFPDPWPKARHHKRRLFDVETVDLVLGMLRPGGHLFFATDHVEYGEIVRQVLTSHPGLRVSAHDAPWPGGARTNYEAKYVEEGRPILRLVAKLVAESRGELLHPAGRDGIAAATAVREEVDPASELALESGSGAVGRGADR